jgi:phasin family protein
MQTQSQFLDMYRSIARAAIDTMKASLESTERFHQQQLHIVRGALEQNIKSASELSQARSIDELLSLQSQVAGAQVAQAMDVWRGLYRMMSDSQMTAMSQMQTQVSQASDTVRQAYDLTARATEDAARIAASQVSAVSAAASREAAPQERKAGEQQRKTA